MLVEKLQDLLFLAFTHHLQNKQKGVLTLTPTWQVEYFPVDEILHVYKNSALLSTYFYLWSYLEEAATPGGLNEQTLKAMKETEHYSIHSSSLESILNRLEGK